MDPQGLVLARYPAPDRWIGKTAPEKTLLRALLEGGEGVVRAPGPDGKPRILGLARTGTGPRDRAASAIVSIPEDTEFADLNRILVRNLTGLGLAALIAIVAAWIGTVDEMAGALRAREMERARTAEALAQRASQLETLRAVTAEMTRELELPSLLNLITRRAIEPDLAVDSR